MKRLGEVAKKQHRQNDTRIAVSLRYVPAPDSDGRLYRTIEILLRAAARNTSQSKESANAKEKEPPQALEKDAPNGGDRSECR